MRKLFQMDKNRPISFFTALKYSFIVLRIFTVFPISKKDNRLTTSWAASLYSYIVLSIYILCLVFLYIYWTLDFGEFGKINGFLWVIITTLDNSIGILSFCTICILSERKKHSQVLFFKKLKIIDSIFTSTFNLTPNYRSLRRWHIGSILFCLIYFQLLTFILVRRFKKVGIVNETNVCFYTITYFLEQITAALATFSYINCSTLIRTRAKILQQIVTTRRTDQMADYLPIILITYQEIICLIDNQNEITGFILLVRCLHDFILITGTSYLLVSLLSIYHFTNIPLLSAVTTCIIQVLVKLILVAAAAESTINEVNFNYLSYTLEIFIYFLG